MFAKQYEVALGCCCFEPLLISIWNILKNSPFTAQGSEEPYPFRKVPVRGYDGVLVVAGQHCGRQLRECDLCHRDGHGDRPGAS